MVTACSGTGFPKNLQQVVAIIHMGLKNMRTLWGRELRA